MSYELEGTLKEVFETKTFGKGFTKREFVVTVSKGPDDRYPQHIRMTVVKDKVGLLDRFQSGQRVKVQFDIRGNESNGRYFVDLQAWRIDAAEGGGGREEVYYEDEPPQRDRRDPRGGPRDDRGPKRPPPRREYDDEDTRDFRGGRDDEMPF